MSNKKTRAIQAKKQLLCAKTRCADLAAPFELDEPPAGRCTLLTSDEDGGSAFRAPIEDILRAPPFPPAADRRWMAMDTLPPPVTEPFGKGGRARNRSRSLTFQTFVFARVVSLEDLRVAAWSEFSHF